MVSSKCFCSAETRILTYKILTTDNKILFTGVTDENGFLEWKNIKNSNFSIIFEV